MESERQRNLQQQMEDINTKGLQSAYDRAQAQRLAESQLGLEAQKGTEQSRQYGYGQGMNAAQLGAQYGLEGARQSEQSRQFGANLGLQSLNPMLSAANTLGGLGQQQFGAGLQGLQAQMGAGAVQQQLAQQPLDFGYQQFQESVKFPYQQATYICRACFLGYHFRLHRTKQTLDNPACSLRSKADSRAWACTTR